MSVETEGLAPEERAQRYIAKAEQARLLVSKTADPMLQEALKKLAADWEYLATYVLKARV